MLGHCSKPWALAATALLLLSFKPAVDSKNVVVSIGADALSVVEDELKLKPERSMVVGDQALLEIPAQAVPALSSLMHRKFERCGGFMVEEAGWEAGVANLKRPEFTLAPVDKDLYRISEQAKVQAALATVNEDALRAVIVKMASYQNRYYQSRHGVSSQQWVAERWSELTKGNSAVKVELVRHQRWAQPSVVLTWQGSEKPDEVVVLGGHGDSIAGWSPSNEVHAPGADDNASGVATITEVLRALTTTNFVPARTLKFMSYAAEEVGLRGSQDIAASYRAANINVVGVMQLDMTNFAGSAENIVFITDHTNQGQNAFLQDLLGAYLPEIKFASDECGYACSDHASWTRHGYPASFPFEARMDDHNQAIHTARDTLARSDNHARHAVPFAKLAAAFMIELASH